MALRLEVIETFFLWDFFEQLYYNISLSFFSSFFSCNYKPVVIIQQYMEWNLVIHGLINWKFLNQKKYVCVNFVYTAFFVQTKIF